MFKNVLIPFLLAFFLVACDDRDLSESMKSRLDAESEIHEFKAFIDNRDNDIELRGERFESLVYSNENEECKSVLWYLDDTLVLVREMIRNQNTEENHEVSYYFKNGRLHLVQDIGDLPSKDEMISSELIVYFENDEPLRAWSNVTNDGVFDASLYKDAQPQSFSPKRSIDMFTHETDFVLHFDGFLETGGDLYLLVNTGTEKSYIAALKINEMDDFLNELRKNEQRHKNAPLHIEHQAVNQGGWVFHYYIRGKFL